MTTVVPFPHPARRQSATFPHRACRRMDRAAVATVAVLTIVTRALRARHHDGDRSAIPLARLEVEELLRGEFADARGEAINEIRLHDE
jgi:hypothetical protein